MVKIRFFISKNNLSIGQIPAGVFFLKKSRFVLSHHVYRADLPEPSVPEVAPVLRRSGHEREEGEEEMEARKDKGSKQVRFLCSLTH